MYQLDKDLLQINIPINERLYSDRTCLWLPNDLNLAISNNSVNINIYDKCIYKIDNMYFIKIYSIYSYALGPFYDINSARNALNNIPNKINMCIIN
jgi:hypothetical protein